MNKEYYLDESIKLITRAIQIEDSAVEKYIDSLHKIKSKDLTKILFVILVDTIIHRETVKSFKRALEEINDIQKKFLEKHNVETQEDIEFVIETIKDHMALEKNMVDLYGELANDMNQPEVMRDIYKVLQANERLHHKLLEDLLRYLE